MSKIFLTLIWISIFLGMTACSNKNVEDSNIYKNTDIPVNTNTSIIDSSNNDKNTDSTVNTDNKDIIDNDDKVDWSIPYVVRIGSILYHSTNELPKYSLIDKNIIFESKGKIETCTEDINAYPDKNNETNFDGYLDSEYGFIDGHLYIKYREFIPLQAASYQPSLKLIEKIDVMPEKEDNVSLEEAIDDGFMVLKNANIYYGDEIWQMFLTMTQFGYPTTIRIAHYYTMRGRISESLYESTKDDYPKMYLSQLYYDGEKYIVSALHKVDGKYECYQIQDVDGPEKTYQYLMHYFEKPQNTEATFNFCEKYVLVNDNSITWEDIYKGMISSQAGAAIDHTAVYNKYDYKEGIDPDWLEIVKDTVTEETKK